MSFHRVPKLPFCVVQVKVGKHVSTGFRLKETDFTALMAQAPRYHGCPSRLMRDLIVTIARDGMVNAVLDVEAEVDLAALLDSRL